MKGVFRLEENGADFVEKDPNKIVSATEKELESLQKGILELKEKYKSLVPKKILDALKNLRLSLIPEFYKRIMALEKVAEKDEREGDFGKYIQRDIEFLYELDDFEKNGHSWKFEDQKNFFEQILKKLEDFFQISQEKEVQTAEREIKIIPETDIFSVKTNIDKIYEKVHISTAQAINAKINPFADSLIVLIQKKVRSAKKEIDQTRKDLKEIKKKLESREYKMNEESLKIILDLYWKFKGKLDPDQKKNWKGIKEEIKTHMTSEEYETEEIQILLNMFEEAKNLLEEILILSGKESWIK